MVTVYKPASSILSEAERTKSFSSALCSTKPDSGNPVTIIVSVSPQSLSGNK